MATENAKKSTARDRIVETAEQLFYAEGVRAVGIDRIIAEADVAKMTLYNHFASKDDLILAVLEHREQEVNQMFADSIARHVRKGKSNLEAFFATLKDWFKSPGFRGCSFINASVELADCDHPASQFACEHKRRQNKMIALYAEEMAGERASSLAPALSLLVEGAIVTAAMERSPKSADVARDAALALLGKKTIAPKKKRR